MAARSSPRIKRLGTFEGVFVPTTLTILGVILFTRTGWVVGQMGLGGALVIITGAYLVSLCTALSVSSIVTNVRVEGGGAFALLTRTLGLEPGGAIGVPFYLSQALATVLYIFGFRAGWGRIFPGHPAWAVDLGVFAIILALATVSARLAFRSQYLVLAILAASLVAIGLGLPLQGVAAEVTWIHQGGVGLWEAFAVFFPAVTGIMAGVNMSGELAEPRASIARGSLAAIGLTWLIYVGAAVVLALRVPMETLRGSDTALVQASAWGPLVLAGLLAATFSSALSTTVGAPRILEALARQGVLPGGRWLSWRSPWGEPVVALAATALIVLCGIGLRDLNTVAPLITLFFLLTYGAINATLLVQQGLRMPRFRPTFRVPLAVPLVGTVGCLGGMVLVSPAFTLVAVASVAGLYALMVRRSVDGPTGQVRAGIIVTLASWVWTRLRNLPGEQPWQAHAMAPVSSPRQAAGAAALLQPLVQRGGSLAFVVMQADGEDVAEAARYEAQALHRAGAPGRVATLPGDDVMSRLLGALEMASATLIPPNLLVLPWGPDDAPWLTEGGFAELAGLAQQARVGLWLADLRPEDPGPDESAPPWASLTVWLGELADDHTVRPQGRPLVLLAAWRMQQSWQVPVRLCTALEEVASDDERQAARDRLAQVRDRARIPGVALEARIGALPDLLREDDESLHLVVLNGPMDAGDVHDLREAAPGRLVVAALSGEAEAE